MIIAPAVTPISRYSMGSRPASAANRSRKATPKKRMTTPILATTLPVVQNSTNAARADSKPLGPAEAAACATAARSAARSSSSVRWAGRPLPAVLGDGGGTWARAAVGGGCDGSGGGTGGASGAADTGGTAGIAGGACEGGTARAGSGGGADGTGRRLNASSPSSRAVRFRNAPSSVSSRVLSAWREPHTAPNASPMRNPRPESTTAPTTPAPMAKTSVGLKAGI